MKAVTCPRYGPPNVLEVREIPRPAPGPGELLIRVHASTVNRTDTATLRAHPFFARPMTGWLRPRHPVTGMDFAGIVAAIGPGVQGFAEGDRVFGLSPDRFGAHAEYIVVSQEDPVALVPERIALDQAVICEGAWYANSTTSRLGPDDHILIYGASGAIGTAAVQLAKARGAQVTAVVSTSHLALAHDLGADRVVDYTAEDFTKTSDRFDVVMDAVGHTSWFACRHMLKPGGHFCATDLGPGWSNLWLGLWPRALGGISVGVPFPRDPAGFVRELALLMERGEVRGVFDRHYGMDEIVEAFTYVETGQKTGTVVLDIAAGE